MLFLVKVFLGPFYFHSLHSLLLVWCHQNLIARTHSHLRCLSWLLDSELLKFNVLLFDLLYF